MMVLLSLILVIMTIMIILIMVLNITSKKSINDREKSSPFECGFDPKASSRLPFSMHFFLIAIIFLIFDVEITLLFPIIISMKLNNLTSYLMVTSIFIIILMVGLFHEWKQGALNWTN